jgi:radical SAM superfamily enzyme YgiQ (UPF0313 family)
VKKFRFVDDALPPAFMKKLVPLFRRELPDCSWRSSLILSNHFADSDFCRELKDSGLSRVTIGLESVSNRVLKKMNKYHQNISEPEIIKVMSTLTGEGIKVGLHIIFGFPTETLSEARYTLDFLLRHRNLYDVCWVQPFCLEDGIPIFQHPEEFGISKIYLNDKNSGERLGYRYDVSEGMTQEEAKEFTYKTALPALRKAGVAH